MINEKKEARKILKQKIDSLTPDEKKVFSEKAEKNFLSTDFYKNADIILAFKAMDDEPSADEIITKAVNDGKKVFLPVVDIEKTEMDFFSIREDSSFLENSYGTLEPDKKTETKLDIEGLHKKNIVILVPGRGFTKSGERLGRGKGYYDKFISLLKEKNGTTVFTTGFCYAVQTEINFVTESHDIKMDAVVTERGIIFSDSSNKL